MTKGNLKNLYIMKGLKRWPSILIIIVTQLAWLAVVVLWIAWFVNRHYALIHRLGPWDILILVEGAVLLLLILAGIWILFVLYQRQVTLAKTQANLMASITHEFKTPLATIQLYLETMRSRNLPEKTTEKLIAGMMQENQRLKELVDKFLEGSCLYHGRAPYMFKPMPLKTLLKDFIDRHPVLLENIDIELIDIDEDIKVSVDIQAFEIVLSNLTENAIHYSEGTPRIEIRSRVDRSRVCMEFKDYGIGIPRSKAKDVFKLFTRLPEGISLWGRGTGMGLYIVKQIMKAHGGSIRLEETSAGQGSTFLLCLPRKRENGRQ